MKDNKRIIEKHAKAIAKACKEYIQLFSKKHHLEGDYVTSNAVLMPYYGIDRVIDEECADTLLGYNDYLLLHEEVDGSVLSFHTFQGSFKHASAKIRRKQEKFGGRAYVALILETYGAEPEANEGIEEEG